MAEVGKKLDERLRTLEDNNVLSVDVGEMYITMEQLEDKNQLLKDGLRTLEQNLDVAENHAVEVKQPVVLRDTNCSWRNVGGLRRQ